MWYVGGGCWLRARSGLGKGLRFILGEDPDPSASLPFRLSTTTIPPTLGTTHSPAMADDREISRLFRVNKTIHELVDDRVSQLPPPLPPVKACDLLSLAALPVAEADGLTLLSSCLCLS